eukprot:3586324-Pyramimonas_sp.AAC.1
MRSRAAGLPGRTGSRRGSIQEEKGPILLCGALCLEKLRPLWLATAGFALIRVLFCRPKV